MTAKDRRMFAALNGAHGQTLVSAALERFDRRKSHTALLGEGPARIPRWRGRGLPRPRENRHAIMQSIVRHADETSFEL